MNIDIATKIHSDMRYNSHSLQMPHCTFPDRKKYSRIENYTRNRELGRFKKKQRNKLEKNGGNMLKYFSGK